MESENVKAARSGAAFSDNHVNYSIYTNKRDNSFPTHFELEAECLSHMRAHEIPFEGPLCADGEIHRFSIDHKHSKKDEWYAAKAWYFKERPYLRCSYGSWSQDKTYTFHSWKDGSEFFSQAEREELARHVNNMEKAASKERTRVQDDAAKNAQSIWDSAQHEPTTAEHFAYLQLKNIKGHGVRFGTYFSDGRHNDCMIIPLQDIEGAIRSLQFVWVDEKGSQKRFLAGGEKKGCFFVLGDLNEFDSFNVSEGFATAASIREATEKPLVVAFDCGNLDPVLCHFRREFPNHRITIAADDDVDQPNNPGRKKAEEVSNKYHCDVIFPKFPKEFKLPNGKSGSDFNDLHVHCGIEEVKKQFQRTSHLRPINIADILSRDIPPKMTIMKPWLREKDLVMLYASRGLGKTWFALSVACSIAAGGNFLKFEASEPRRVLYVDGEMPAVTIKERLAKILNCSDAKIKNPDFLQIINQDLEENTIRDLGTHDGQNDINELIQRFDVLILDNLSCLTHTGDENDASSWVSIQGWLLRLRKLGKTVIVIHHAGKKGQQRGTSKREDVLDTVIALKKPKDWSPTDGARFEIHYEKNRGFEGDDATPFEARLNTNADGTSVWSSKDVVSGKQDEAFNLREEGMSITDIAKELGVNKSTVSRWFKSGKR